MGSYFDYLKERMANPAPFDFTAPWRSWKRNYESAHGSDRFWLSQDPIYGRIQQAQDRAKQWDDQYNITGRDPSYSTSYGSGGLPFVNDVMNGLGVSPAKMSKSLAKMYGCEVLLDVNKERMELEQMRAVNRYNYMVGSHALAEHWMDYQRMKNRN